MTLPSPETLAALRLIRSHGVGPITYHGLIAKFGSAARALEALPNLNTGTSRKKKFSLASVQNVEDELRRLEKMGARLVAMTDPNYPGRLAEISDAPPFLTVLGDTAHLNTPAVGIVGARNASTNGRKLAAMLAADLAKAGYTVWSGLARGIDTAAHAAAIETSTVAVMAGSVDHIYPRENTALHARICQTGAVVSEMPVGTEPQAQHFPRRNRLISGASLGVVIVEGTPRSGSLITARFALEQGREVFAVPGSPLDPRAQGPNTLIRDGAVLVRDADDILDELSAAVRFLTASHPAPEQPAQVIEKVDESAIGDLAQQILSEIGAGSVTVDELRRQCQVSAPILAAALLDLELAEQIERLPGNRVSAIGGGSSAG